jgi:hypothetical protein
MIGRRPPESRIWQYIDQSGDCWIWTGSKMPRARCPYGMFCIERGRPGMVHKWLYEYVYGPVAHGMELDHLCRQSLCVNPTHLEPVSHRENVRRGASMIKRSHCKRGHSFSLSNTLLYASPSGGQRQQCRECNSIRRQRHQLKKKEVGL